MTLGEELIRLIGHGFSTQDAIVVKQALESITLAHVMASSEINLEKTRRAVLHLSNGRVEDVNHYSECAIRDFRDVIYWSDQNKDANS